MSILGGGDDPKQKVTAYYASVLYGVCTGPVDEVREIWYGEKMLWSGDVAESSMISVSKPDLFGGDKVEGGFIGTLFLMFGDSNQQSPAALGESMKRNGATDTADPAALPGNRGLLSLFITGASAGN